MNQQPGTATTNGAGILRRWIPENERYNNGQYNNGENWNNGQYNNGRYNNGRYNNGQYNNGQYNNGQYNRYNNGENWNNDQYNNGAQPSRIAHIDGPSGSITAPVRRWIPENDRYDNDRYDNGRYDNGRYNNGRYDDYNNDGYNNNNWDREDRDDQLGRDAASFADAVTPTVVVRRWTPAEEGVIDEQNRQAEINAERPTGVFARWWPSSWPRPCNRYDASCNNNRYNNYDNDRYDRCQSGDYNDRNRWSCRSDWNRNRATPTPSVIVARNQPSYDNTDSTDNTDNYSHNHGHNDNDDYNHKNGHNDDDSGYVSDAERDHRSHSSATPTATAN
jgi:hypothetical protein